MRTIIFANRNFKEILREPINLFFGLAFPIILLSIMSLMNKNLPVDIFAINNLGPGISIFGLSFMSIFGGLIISKDRSSAFLQRLYTTPLKSGEMILGYLLPLIPASILQATICYIVSLLFGLTPSAHILVAILAIVPISIFFISLGLLFGSFCNEKIIGSTLGSILPVLCSLIGGVWMDLEILGETMKTIAYCLPFANAVRLEQCLAVGKYDGTLTNFLIILAYSAVTLTGAIVVFFRQMKRQ